MDIKFENRYYCTDEIISEYVSKVLSKRIKLLGTIIALLSIVTTIGTLYDRKYILATVFGLCLFLSLFITISAPAIIMKQIKHSTKSLHNGKKFESVFQFGDNINISEGSFSLSVEYSQIQKVYSLHNSYVLMFGKSNAIILSPDHFAIGTFEDFKLFIREKCPQVKAL